MRKLRKHALIWSLQPTPRRHYAAEQPGLLAGSNVASPGRRPRSGTGSYSLRDRRSVRQSTCAGRPAFAHQRDDPPRSLEMEDTTPRMRLVDRALRLKDRADSTRYKSRAKP